MQSTVANALPSSLVNSSLQEVAPLSHSFIGSYLLSPYYSRFEEALNLAAAKVLTATENDAADLPAQPGGSAPYPYTLVRAKNVGMTAIMLFSKTPAAIHHVEEAECGFGAADMGNKGAVGLRISWTPGTGDGGGSVQPEAGVAPETTELTFVAMHLAAMEWNLKRRNANWKTIMSGLTFANPRKALPGLFPSDESAPTPDRTGTGRTPPRPSSADSSEAEEEEGQPFLRADSDDDLSPIEPSHPDFPGLTSAHHATLHDLSIYKPTSHLFVGGDLNYRISTTTPPPMATFPSMDPESENYFPSFLARDQLTIERTANRTLQGMAEAPIRFGPTYKYNVQHDAAGATNEAAVRRGTKINGIPEIPWRFASHRWPGWCDRILFLEVPSWVTSSSSSAPQAATSPEEPPRIDVLAYDSLPVVTTSDHRAVFFRASVPLIEPDAMRPPEVFSSAVERLDPRASLPVPVDVHAWERRAAARRKEIVVGWTAFVWSTREGAMLLATVLLVGVSAWWLVKMW